MVSGFKKAVFKLIDKALAQEGYVLAVRKWTPASMYEIDLHLPGVDMNKWTTIPRLKIKVGEPGEYRDYTPGKWNVAQKTCTLWVETDHKGFGSSWAKSLQIGDTVIFAPAHAASLPSSPGKVTGFGDGSALGHFFALKQLTDSAQNPLEAVIFLNENYILPESLLSNNPEFQFVMKPGANCLDTLRSHAENISLTDVSFIYIAGYIPMVTGLRKLLRNDPGVKGKIVAHGFWS